MKYNNNQDELTAVSNQLTKGTETHHSQTYIGDRKGMISRDGEEEDSRREVYCDTQVGECDARRDEIEEEVTTQT